MYFIDPHIHTLTRTTFEYQDLARMGCIAVSEPAFWPGYDRSSCGSFRDYFGHLTGFEVKRAATYGIKYYTWMCINPKDAENIELAREVVAMIPEFLECPNVLGVGEIGLHKNTKNEAEVFRMQMELALDHEQLILIHTPHLVDKYPGTRMILDMLGSDPRIVPERVLVDHLEEHTVRHVLDAGYWAGLTMYPISKCTPERAADIIEMYGPERLMVNSAADWGPSDPKSIPNFIIEMRRRGHSEKLIRQVVHENPIKFWRGSKNFNEADLLDISK